MKWLSLIIALLLPIHAFAAIAIDSSAKPAANTSSFTQVLTGSNITAFLCITTSASSVTVSSPTIDGNAMSVAGSISETQNFTYLFYKTGLSSETATFAFTPSGSGYQAFSASYTGTNSTLDNSQTAASSSLVSSFGMSITAVAPNAWAVLCESNGDTGATAGANITIRQTTNATAGDFGDTNGAFTGTKSQTLSIPAPARWAAVQATIAPASAPSTATYDANSSWFLFL